MWIPIFKTGSYADTDGNPKVWTEHDLDEIVSESAQNDHEVPVSIGPITDTSPAWAWIKALKRQDNVLYADLDALPEFEEMIKKGVFTKRSVSFYPRGSLRTVSFLGAEPPKIPGLDVVKFSGKASTIIEFSESQLMGSNSSERLSALAYRKMAEKEGISFKEALLEVQKENPGAAREYITDYLTVTTIKH